MHYGEGPVSAQQAASGVFLSVVIPTYNRERKITRAVRSARDTFDGDVSYEIIVINDASTDNTVDALKGLFAKEIAADYLRILINPENVGVTASRNIGYKAARGTWILCLDSDDQLLTGVSRKILEILKENDDRAIVFMRCIDNYGNLVGKEFNQDVILDLRTYLEYTSYGEVLVALNKKLILEPPFVDDLRGYEGLSFSRIIRDHGPALLSPVIARRYDRSGHDRLSSFTGFFNRLTLLARGHITIVREFGHHMTIKKKFTYLLKASVYMIVGVLYQITGGSKKK